MPYTPVRGKLAKLTIGATDVPAINWDLGIDGKPNDVSNFRDGRKVDTTLDDADLKFTAVWDEADPVTDAGAANLRIGVALTAKCYSNAAATVFWELPVRVTMLGPKVANMESHVMVDITAKLNGTVTYPVDPP
jgi:hypothetical protein